MITNLEYLTRGRSDNGDLLLQQGLFDTTAVIPSYIYNGSISNMSNIGVELCRGDRLYNSTIMKTHIPARGVDDTEIKNVLSDDIIDGEGVLESNLSLTQLNDNQYIEFVDEDSDDYHISNTKSIPDSYLGTDNLEIYIGRDIDGDLMHNKSIGFDHVRNDETIRMSFSVGKNTNILRKYTGSIHINSNKHSIVFDEDMAEFNIGSGDKVIAGKYIYYLEEKLSQNEWVLIDIFGAKASGDQMYYDSIQSFQLTRAFIGGLKSVIQTPVSGGFYESDTYGLYTLLREINDVNPNNLVNMNISVSIILYRDVAEIDISDPIEIAGWEATRNNYIRVETATLKNASRNNRETTKKDNNMQAYELEITVSEYVDNLRIKHVNAMNIKINGFAIEGISIHIKNTATNANTLEYVSGIVSDKNETDIFNNLVYATGAFLSMIRVSRFYCNIANNIVYDDPDRVPKVNWNSAYPEGVVMANHSSSSICNNLVICNVAAIIIDSNGFEANNIRCSTNTTSMTTDAQFGARGNTDNVRNGKSRTTDSDRYDYELAYIDITNNWNLDMSNHDNYSMITNNGVDLSAYKPFSFNVDSNGFSREYSTPGAWCVGPTLPINPTIRRVSVGSQSNKMYVYDPHIDILGGSEINTTGDNLTLRLQAGISAMLVDVNRPVRPGDLINLDSGSLVIAAIIDDRTISGTVVNEIVSSLATRYISIKCASATIGAAIESPAMMAQGGKDLRSDNAKVIINVLEAVTESSEIDIDGWNCSAINNVNIVGDPISISKTKTPKNVNLTVSLSLPTLTNAFKLNSVSYVAIVDLEIRCLSNVNAVIGRFENRNTIVSRVQVTGNANYLFTRNPTHNYQDSMILINSEIEVSDTLVSQIDKSDGRVIIRNSIIYGSIDIDAVYSGFDIKNSIIRNIAGANGKVNVHIDSCISTDDVDGLNHKMNNDDFDELLFVDITSSDKFRPGFNSNNPSTDNGEDISGDGVMAINKSISGLDRNVYDVSPYAQTMRYAKGYSIMTPVNSRDAGMSNGSLQDKAIEVWLKETPDQSNNLEFGSIHDINTKLKVNRYTDCIINIEGDKKFYIGPGYNESFELGDRFSKNVTIRTDPEDIKKGPGEIYITTTAHRLGIDISNMALIRYSYQKELSLNNLVVSMSDDDHDEYAVRSNRSIFDNCRDGIGNISGSININNCIMYVNGEYIIKEAYVYGSPGSNESGRCDINSVNVVNSLLIYGNYHSDSNLSVYIKNGETSDPECNLSNSLILSYDVNGKTRFSPGYGLDFSVNKATNSMIYIYDSFNIDWAGYITSKNCLIEDPQITSQVYSKIDVLPSVLFSDVRNLKLHIKSPAVDAGDSSMASDVNIKSDIVGVNRFFLGGNVDIGAFEMNIDNIIFSPKDIKEIFQDKLIYTNISSGELYSDKIFKSKYSLDMYRDIPKSLLYNEDICLDYARESKIVLKLKTDSLIYKTYSDKSDIPLVEINAQYDNESRSIVINKINSIADGMLYNIFLDDKYTFIYNDIKSVIYVYIKNTYRKGLSGQSNIVNTVKFGGNTVPVI